jgi:SAM-dependent methyltransferase
MSGNEASTPWFEEFFDQHYLDYWAQMLHEERTSREVEFLVGALDLPNGARILDLCCGQARHAVELARLGYEVTGLDLNRFLLDAGRRLASKAGVEVRFVEGDMREIPFEGAFDAVVNLFTAFGYFEEERENERALESVERCLKPGGVFLLDQTHVLRAAADFQPRVWTKFDDGTLLVEEREFDARTVRYRTRAVYVRPDGRRAERRNDIRCYTCAELSGMLERAGLEVTDVYGGFDGSELTIASKRLIVISRRPTG